jgi:protein MPE1
VIVPALISQAVRYFMIHKSRYIPFQATRGDTSDPAVVTSGGAETVEDELEALDAIQQQAEVARNTKGGNKVWTASGGSRPSAPMVPRPGPVRPRPTGELQAPSNQAPPRDYLCFRCAVPGHFIQNCPTNGDPNYDKHKVTKKTGIPKTFMKTITDPDDVSAVGSGITVVNGPQGGLAVIGPQTHNFTKLIARSGGGALLDQWRMNPPEHLGCSLCKRLMQDAALIPCCSGV